MRLQKFMAQAGVASRRKAEEIIAEGRVYVNGRVVREMGVQVEPGDEVVVDGKRIQGAQHKRYFMLYKPRGIISTCSDERGRPTVMRYVEHIDDRLYPVGRLDGDSEGLLLLTNDGAWANALTSAKNHVPKVYAVSVVGEIDDDKLDLLCQGVVLDDGVKSAPSRVVVQQITPQGARLSVTLYQGRNRQIRRMMESVGLRVSRLKREQVGTLTLGSLRPGEIRELSVREAQHVLPRKLHEKQS